MTPGQSKHLVLASVVVTGVLATVNDISKGHTPRTRVALGLLVAGVGLSVMADFSPDLAGSFAALLLVSAVFNVGGSALSTISKGLQK